jgi:hypothetical protein
MLDITAANTNFVDGQVTLGFGTSDISVRRVWVRGPAHLVADVVVAANAAAGDVSVDVISGFQVISAPAAFQIQPPNGSLPAIALPVDNGVSYAPSLHPGDYGTIFGANLSATPTSAQVILNGSAAPLAYASAGQINFIIPAATPVGPSTLVVSNGPASTYPVMLEIDGPQPAIEVPAVASTNPGDIVSVQVTNVDPGIVSAPGRVQVTMSRVPMNVLSVTPVSAAANGQPASPGVFQIQFAVTQSFAGSTVPLVVLVDGSPSTAVEVMAR